MGVDEARIVGEEKSNTTYGQLLNVIEIAKQNGICELSVVSSDYHLPRVRAMMENIDELRNGYLDIKINYISAEEVCAKEKPEYWRDLIKDAYNSEYMKSIIGREKKGVQDIEDGIYKYSI